ncbi:hypothetical protein AM1_C0025 (plasmid) [Acaryochloris marina MBIC11017]|uniref:Uncharacterized protein n=1 Tax=Acaryochloris marina (strain MBIC 11017) TaxID=329726 RepID=A8ZMC4_ACAM1|nr:hypothetical protein AM1_C0025 [Acaryochloris marina MBIC11017]
MLILNPFLIKSIEGMLIDTNGFGFSYLYGLRLAGCIAGATRSDGW